MRTRIGTGFVTRTALVLALAAAPATALAGDEDAALTAAMKNHFAGASQPGPASGDATASPDAMVAYFTSGPPPGDTTVASRRHVDLDVKFSFDSAALDEEGIHQLDVAGKALQSPQLKGRRFMLAGHTDDSGNADYNAYLSKQRAESARKYLIDEYGIEPERLAAAGFGSDQPRSTEQTPEARRLNRRVVLELVQ